MKALKLSLLFLSLLLSLSVPCFSQQYSLTSRDQDEIVYQAQLTLSMYKDLLNVISYADLATESEIKKLIKNSYTNSRSQIFYSEGAIIEDNIKPSNLSSRHEQDKTIKDYLNYFDLAYVKADEETIEFSDFEVSNIKYGNYLYIKVKYTSLFKGKHKEDAAEYKAVDRVAELRVEKRNNAWKTFITSIVYFNPENPLSSGEGDVKLESAVSESGTFAQLTDEISKENNASSGQTNQAENFSEKKKEQDIIFNHFIEEGERALAAGKLEEAFAAFSEAEKINPFHQDLWQKLMELTKAQNLQISSVENRYAHAKRNGDLAYAARDYTKAKNLYAEALRLRPEEEQLKVEMEKLERLIQKMALMESKYAVGEYKEAVKEYTKAIRKDRENPDYYLGRGKAYEQLEDVKNALKDYSKAIELDANFIEALNSRARLYTETQQFHKAVADYTLILSNPDYAAAFYPQRARVKKIMGDVNGAIEDYNAAIQHAPTEVKNYFEKGNLLLSQKKSKEAIQSFSEAIERDSRFVEAVYQRGFAYASMERLRLASSDFKRARELGLEESQLAEINKLAFHYYTKGEGAMEENKFTAALESFKDALLISPAFGRVWLRAGDAYYNLEDYDNAISNYERAVEYDRMSFAYFKKGLAHQQKGDAQLADNDFKKYIPIGKELLASAKKGNIVSETGAAGVNIVEERADALYALGYAQLMTYQFVDALENLDMAIHNRKFFPKAYFARGSALYALEDYRRAVKDMEESVKMGLSEPLVFYSLGRAYYANGQLDDAILSYSHAIKVKPEYDLAYKERAICYNNAGQYSLAMDDIKKALSLNNAFEEDVVVLTQRGLAQLHLNKLTEASQSFEQALRLDENNGWALFGKASVLARGNKVEESLDWYRKAFQTGQIEWAVIKKDPLIDPVSKQKRFKELVKTYL